MKNQNKTVSMFPLYRDNVSEDENFNELLSSRLSIDSLDSTHSCIKEDIEIDLFYNSLSKSISLSQDSVGEAPQYEEESHELDQRVDYDEHNPETRRKPDEYLKRDAELPPAQPQIPRSDKCSHKSVSFRRHRDIKLIPHRNELTEYKSSLWYNRNEFEAMEIDRENTVTLIRKGITNFDDELNFTCIRGLEHLVSEEQEVQRHENIGFVVINVLEEQYKQCEENPYFDEEAIAQVSLKYTKWSKDMAFVMAQIDESYAFMQRDMMNSERQLASKNPHGLAEKTANSEKPNNSVHCVKTEVRNAAEPCIETIPGIQRKATTPLSDKKNIASEIVFTFR